MKNKETQIVLDENIINKLNEYLGDLGILKSTYNLFLYCLENEIYVYTKSEIDSFAYILQLYIQKLKSDFANFLQEENLLL